MKPSLAAPLAAPSLSSLHPLMGGHATQHAHDYKPSESGKHILFILMFLSGKHIFFILMFLSVQHMVVAQEMGGRRERERAKPEERLLSRRGSTWDPPNC